MIKRFLTIFGIVLLLALPARAQELQKGGMYVFSDFGGGLNTKDNAFSLQKNQEDIAENVRFDTEGKSVSKRDKTVLYGTANATNPILGLHRFYINDGTKVLLTNYSNKVAKGNDSTGAFTDILTLTNGDRKAQWLTWHNLAIGTDGYNQPYKYDGSSASATYLGAPLATDAGSGAGPNGTYNYKVTCYTSSYEVSLGATSNSLTVVDNDISLSMIPICPDTYLGEDVTGRKIYRNGTGDTTYKMLSNGTIANNTAVVLTDSDTDGERTDAYAVDATATPPKGKLSVIHMNRLWIANDPSHPSRIYFSDDSSHDYFPTLNYFDIRANDGDEITFAKNLLGKLTIGKNNTIQKIYTDGDTPLTDWQISDPFSFVGCHAMYSAVNTPVGLVYLSNNGIYSFNGQYSKLISNQVTPEIRDINSSNFVNIWGEYFKNAYYMAYTSASTGATSNDRVLVLDLINKAYSIDLFNVGVFHVLRSGTDIEALYSGDSSVGKIYAHNETIRELVHKIHDDFTGTFTDMRYIPVAVGGNASSPVLELSRTATIDSVTPDTVDSITGTIDRTGDAGTYVSQYLSFNASTFDKIYWNETIPLTGGNVTLAIRGGATTTDTSLATWSSEYSDPSGSDISAYAGTTDSVYGQYRITMTTDSAAYTPTVYRSGNYVVRLTYNSVGTSTETSVPMHVRTGWSDLGFPGYKKTLRKIYAYYDSDSLGTLNIKLENFEGDEDTFAINLITYPSQYTEYFTSGALVGELFRLDLQESSLNALRVKRIIMEFDLEPLY